jgi:O-antigen/teichoic acid export membrane protein
MTTLRRTWSPADVVRRSWQAPGRLMMTNAASMVVATGATSGLGLVYWWLAARQFSPAAVGFASAAISAMTLLGTMAVLGLGTLLIGELPRQHGRERALIVAALLVVGLAGTALGVLFALAAPTLSPELQPLALDLGSVALFAIGAGVTAATLVLDQALIGLLRGGWQLWRNIIFAVVKLMALWGVTVAAAGRLGMTIYLTWVVGAAVSVAVLTAVAARSGPRDATWRPDWRLLRGFGWEPLRHHALNVSLLASSLVMPLVVTAMLSATSTAYFFTASMLTMLIIAVPVALTTVLFRMGAADPPALARWTRLTLGMSALATTLAVGVSLVGAGVALSLFGPSYVENAEWPLRILALNAFPVIVREHYVAINRVQGRLTAAIGPVLGGGLLTIGGAVLGGLMGGLVGLCLGILIAFCIEALYMAPAVYRAARPRGNA